MREVRFQVIDTEDGLMYTEKGTYEQAEQYIMNLDIWHDQKNFYIRKVYVKE